jgi:hypothetical protein
MLYLQGTLKSGDLRQRSTWAPRSRGLFSAEAGWSGAGEKREVGEEVAAEMAIEAQEILDRSLVLTRFFARSIVLRPLCEAGGRVCVESL